MHVHAGSGKISERFGHETGNRVVAPGNRLDGAFEQHSLIAGENGIVHMVQVDFVLAR